MTTYTYSSADIPKSWGDSYPEDYYAISTLVVPDAFTITDLRLSLCVPGGLSELCGWIALQHPDGTGAVVFFGAGFPDACGDPLLADCGVYGGGLQACSVAPEPNVPLSGFIGKVAAGTWTLMLGGIGGGDCFAAATLTSWSLEIDVDEVIVPPIVPPCIVLNDACIVVVDGQSACSTATSNTTCIQVTESL